jgi:tRNA(Ile)-lysidine synthetase-like protein
MNYNNFTDVLQYIPNHQNTIQDSKYKDNELCDSILDFHHKHNTDKYVVSLSGGVDSMVMISIFHAKKIEVIAVHINYNNRTESKKEEEFLITWCEYNNIKLFVKSINNIHRNSSNRTEYENITKNIRFEFYQEIMKKEGANYVLLAHHKDDIVENIFANVCRGRNILDLAVIKNNSKINDINFGRPLSEHFKDKIYKFAHIYQIPYFKDTTPDWSIRGKYRNLIYPSIENAFSKNVKNNLLNISQQSDDWSELIEMQFITPFMKSMKIKKNEVSFDVQQYLDYPLCFWNVVFMRIFNKFGYKSPSKKSVQNCIFIIKSKQLDDNYLHNITLNNTCKCTLYRNILNIELH